MPRAEAVEVGHCRCPVCGSKKARLRVSAKSLAYIVCSACQMQCFARSDQSDERLRAMLVKDEPAPEPVPIQAPAAKPAADPVPTPPPIQQAAKPSRPGWGMQW
jgi:hypothetical protein